MEADSAQPVLVRLRQRARDDQHQAALREYVDADDPCRRRGLLGVLVGRLPTDTDWRHYEQLRAEFRYQADADLTARDIARMTGLTPETIRLLAQQGAMPAPRFRGRWWWWNREEIAAWLAQCKETDPA